MNKSKIQSKNFPVTIYAEISKKQFRQLVSNDVSMQVPHGVIAKHIKGTRQLWFYCDEKEVAEELVDGLDASYINWQEI